MNGIRTSVLPPKGSGSTPPCPHPSTAPTAAPCCPPTRDCCYARSVKKRMNRRTDTRKTTRIYSNMKHYGSTTSAIKPYSSPSARPIVSVGSNVRALVNTPKVNHMAANLLKLELQQQLTAGYTFSYQTMLTNAQKLHIICTNLVTGVEKGRRRYFAMVGRLYVSHGYYRKCRCNCLSHWLSDCYICYYRYFCRRGQIPTVSHKKSKKKEPLFSFTSISISFFPLTPKNENKAKIKTNE